MMKYLSLLMMGLLIHTYTQAAPMTTPEEMLNAINKARSTARQCGRKTYPPAPPLKWHRTLAQVAQQHATDMAIHQYFHHNSRNGQTPTQRIKAAGYRWSFAAENIAAGYRSLDMVMQG